MTDRSDLYTRNQSVDVTSMTLITRSGQIDLWQDNALVALDIFESIFEPFSTANLTMMDNAGWFEEEPLCGDEQLIVIFNSAPTHPFGPMTKIFDAYKIDSFQTVGGSKTRTYTIRLASQIARNDLVSRVRRSFRGLKENEIVASLLNGPLNSSVGEMETTKFKREFVAAGQRPLEVVRYMCETAVRSSGYPSSNYVFFEDRDSRWNFVSLDLLCERDSGKKIKFHLTREFEQSSDTRFASAREFELTGVIDDFANSVEGMYGHKYLAHDIVHKRVESKDYRYRSEFPGQKDPDGTNVFVRERFPEQLDQRVSFGPWQRDLKYDSEHSDDYMMRRDPQFRQWEHNKIKLHMDGTLYVEIGENINFDLYSNVSGVDKLDERNSGQYLVTRLHHIIDFKEHRLVAEVRKNALKT